LVDVLIDATTVVGLIALVPRAVVSLAALRGLPCCGRATASGLAGPNARRASAVRHARRGPLVRRLRIGALSHHCVL
jgi:hypothetical protein